MAAKWVLAITRKRNNQKHFLLRWAWNPVTVSLLLSVLKCRWTPLPTEVRTPFTARGVSSNIISESEWLTSSAYSSARVVEAGSGRYHASVSGGRTAAAWRTNEISCRQKLAVCCSYICIYLHSCTSPLRCIVSFGRCVELLWREKQRVFTCVAHSSTADLPCLAGALLHTSQVDPTPRFSVVIVAKV